MFGCDEGKDRTQSNLCAAHCGVGHQSPDTPNSPQVQPFVAGELAFVLLEIPERRFVTVHPDASQLSHTTAPPLAIRNCCFRI